MIIEEKVINKILFKDLFNDNHPSAELIKDILSYNLGSAVSEYILNVIINPDYEVLSLNDYFKIEYQPDIIEVELDWLSDLGLFYDGYIYGQVVGSDDYGNNFNCHHPKMEVKLFIHDKTGKKKHFMNM